MTADEIARIVDEAAARHGVPSDALMAIANLESSGNVNANNPRSSASGLFQFVDSTAREYGLTGSKRNDPVAQADAAAKMMATNARSLSRTLGREPNAGELYLAHQQGLTGARALLSNPNRPAVDVLAGVYGDRDRARQAVALNGGNLNQSAGQFAGQWVNKANQRASLIPPASVPNVVASQLDTQRNMQGTSQQGTSAISRAFPTRNATPRLAPGLDGVYAYNPPDMQKAQITPGMGSLTPDFFKRDVPMPRLDPRAPNRMDMAAGSRGFPTPLPDFSPSTTPRSLPSLSQPGMVQTSMDRAMAAVDPRLLQALEQRGNMIDTSMQRVASAVDPALQRALEARNGPGVGQPPATRSVASVPVRPQPTGPALSRDSVLQGQRGSYMAQALPNVMTPHQSVPQPPVAVPNAIPGPSPVLKTADALTPGLYPQVATSLAVVPPVTGFPTPVAMRPRPAAGFPTAYAQRPVPQPTMRITVNGGNYSAPQPTREQQIAAILARSRGSSAFGGGGTIDGAVQPIGTLTGRR